MVIINLLKFKFKVQNFQIGIRFSIKIINLEKVKKEVLL